MAQPQTETREELLRRNERKWTKPLMDAGWTCIPTVIIHRQQALGLDSIDVNILLYLASRCWYEENPPFVSVRDIAEVIGVGQRIVQRRITALVKADLLERITRRTKSRGQMSNRYSLRKLIDAVTPFAREELEKRASRREKDAQARARKRPRLESVK